MMIRAKIYFVQSNNITKNHIVQMFLNDQHEMKQTMMIQGETIWFTNKDSHFTFPLSFDFFFAFHFIYVYQKEVPAESIFSCISFKVKLILKCAEQH